MVGRRAARWRGKQDPGLWCPARTGHVNRGAGRVGLARRDATAWRGSGGTSWGPIRASASAWWAAIGMPSR